MLLPWIAGALLFGVVPEQDRNQLFASVQMLTWLFFATLILFAFLENHNRLPYRNRWLFGSMVNVFLILLSYVLSSDQMRKTPGLIHSDANGSFRMQIIEKPLLKSGSVQADARLLQDWPIQGLAGSTVRLYLNNDNLSRNLIRGDEILAYGLLKMPEGPRNPYGFDVRKYYRQKGILATLWIDSRHWKLVGHCKNNESRILKLRSFLLGVFDDLQLKARDKSLLQALVLGEKSELDSDQKIDFKSAGAMHVLAVSGLHVSLVFVVVSFILTRIFGRGKLKIMTYVGVLVVLWLYAAVTGLSASVVRASTMFSLVSIGQMINRKSLTFNTLSLAALLLLFFRPDSLYDLGFQLSFSAVLGILIIQPVLKERWLPRKKILVWFWDLMTVSTAAQLGTFPLSLYYFHQFPNYFLFTNLLVIPLTTLVVYGAILSLLFSFIPFLLHWMGEVMGFILGLFNWVVRFFGNLPGAVTQIYIDPIQAVLVVFIIYSGLVWWKFRRFIFLIISVSAIVVFMLISVVRQYNDLKTSTLIVCSDKRFIHLDFINGSDHQVYTENLQAYKVLSENYRIRYSLDVGSINDLDNAQIFRTFHFGEKDVLLIKGGRWIAPADKKLIKADLIVLAGKIGKSYKHVLECFDAPLFVIHPSLGKYYTEKIIKHCQLKGKGYYLIDVQGAYVRNFFSNFAVISKEKYDIKNH